MAQECGALLREFFAAKRQKFDMPHIRISLRGQILEMFDDMGKRVRSYAVSTAKNGPGGLKGGFCTRAASTSSAPRSAPAPPRTRCSSGAGLPEKSTHRSWGSEIPGATGC